MMNLATPFRQFIGLVCVLAVAAMAGLAPSIAAASTGDVSGTFDVGGYQLYLNCTGTGSPTVVLEAGRSQTWSTWQAVQPAIARFTRVCSYDHAGLGQSDAGPATRSSQTDVDALHTLLDKAGIVGPYVLVGYELGALNVRLYASEYPGEVAGLLLLDPSHEDEAARLQALLSADAWDEFVQEWRADDPPNFDFAASAAQLHAAAPLPRVPLEVITPSAGYPCEDGWPCEEMNQVRQELQASLAKLVPNGKWLTVDSGHFIQQDQPQIVIDAITGLITMARHPDTTPPIIKPRLGGTQGTNGWFTSDVTVDWTVNDPESGIATTAGCENVTLTIETAGTTLSCSATNGAGLSASAQVTVKIDKTPPNVSILSPRALNYVHTVIVETTMAAADALSGIVSDTETLDGTPVTNGQSIDLFYLSLGSHRVVARAVDAAGNTAITAVNFRVVANIDSLIAAEARTCSLGWISNDGICRSLNAKLEAAKAANQRGQPDTMKRILEAFIAHLDAQLGKGVSRQAYTLLKADGEYVQHTLH